MFYKLYIITLCLSFLCSLIGFRLHTPHLKLFSIFLGITVLTEALAELVIHVLHYDTNYSVYVAFMLIEYMLYAVYFRYLIRNSRIRQIINAFLLAFPVVWASTTFLVFGRAHWNSYMILFGDVFTISLCAAWFHESFISEELIDFRASPEFWIAAGTFIYSCCEIPITGILNYLTDNYINLAIGLKNVLQILNILMYLMITYAYLCRRLTNTTKFS